MAADDHDEQGEGGSGDEHGETTGAILAAFLANLGIAVAKFIGFLITGSSSLIAESIHSVADSSNQGLLFLGGKRAERAPTDLHPFGFARSRYFWAFIVAVVLFSVGGLFSLYEGFHKIQEPEEISSPIVAFAIFGFAIVFEAFALRTAVKHAQPQRRGRSWPQFVRTARSPELPVLLLEDSAALVGLLSALAGVTLAEVTGDPIFDGIGTMMIGVVLIGVAVFLAIEMSSLLLGEAARPEDVERIETAMEEHPKVIGVIRILTQHLGPEELIVGIKVEFDHSLEVPELADAIDEAERRIRDAVPAAKHLYVEPDLYDPERSDPDDPGAR